MRLALLIATHYENAHNKAKVTEWRLSKANDAAGELQDMARRAASGKGGEKK